VLRYALVGFIVVSVLNLVFTYGFNTPKMNYIWRGNAELLSRYAILNDKIRSSSRLLDEIGHRDNAVYRSLFGADTLSIAGVYNDYPDERYADLAGERFSPQMIAARRNLDRVARRTYLRSVSLDELQQLAAAKELMATAVPALIPVNPHDIRHIGPFKTNRLHPVLGYVRPHWGIDLTSPRGTPVYAAGDGKVTYAGWYYGLGNMITVDHGYGFRTNYGHLSRMLVTNGQWVKRGEQIGEVGSTGLSSGSHLHYEVVYRGAKVDPMSYIQVNMPAEEFEKIVERVDENAIDKSN
ncbi:MAG: M23 family metallopeptidase, partial [Alistipes sp.]|jgi:murein DD-endopeptidase MepM/ murein hydrolase activator NlpD|nr:M23 family metallopeptidase [Alistipes sp.]